MAILLSEDNGSVSSIEIVAGAKQKLCDQLWQHFSLILTSGQYSLKIGSADQIEDPQARTKAARFRELNDTIALDRVHEQMDAAPVSATEDCLFCRQPRDEVLKLEQMLRDVSENKRERILFEPAEPSFELKVEKGERSGFKVEIWLDNGNAKTGIYRWDAAGVRFFTESQQLRAFCQALKDEFAC